MGSTHTGRSGTAAAGRSLIALARTGSQARVVETHPDLMESAVGLRSREPDQILSMQLVRDAGEGLVKVLGAIQLDVAAATLVRQLPQARVGLVVAEDRKSTRLNSSHGYISYAV